MTNKELSNYKKGSEIAKEVTSLMRDVDLKSKGENCGLLDEWMRCDESAEKVINKFMSESELEKMCSDFVREDRDVEYKKFMKTLSIRRQKRKELRIKLFAQVSVAAAVIAFSFLIYMNMDDAKTESNSVKQISISVPQKTQTKPILILNNGECIDLTIAANEIVNNDLVILKNNNNQLSYQNIDTTQKEEIKYNTIIIPKMFSYNIVLEDGTIVYLNANSELKYPVKFGTDKREVFLKGEGYFDVKKGSRPFIVNANNIEVKVYGTKFNVNASKLSLVKTVLISGSVGVTSPNNAEVLIQPNQMLVANIESGKNTISKVNYERYTAWVDGFFRYDQDKLSDMLEELASWYGVEFILENSENKNLLVTASYCKDTSLKEILESIKNATMLNIIKKGESYIIK